MYMRNAGIGPVGSLVASGLLEDKASIVIAEFESSDPSIGSAATEALRIDLAQSEVIQVVEPASLVGALDRMQLDPHEPLTFDVAREVAIREGYPAVITGEIQSVGNGYTLSARIVDAGSGQTLASHRESAANADGIIPAIDALSAKMRERIGESYSDLRADDPLDQVTTGSLEALEKYTEAIAIFDRGGDTDMMNALLEESVVIDPGFAMAWRKLGLTRNTNSGRIEALENAYAGRDRLTERERLLTEAAYFEWVRRDEQSAIMAYERLIELDPSDTWALNNLGAIYEQDLGDFEQAYEYYRRAFQYDSTVAVHLRNMARAEIDLGMYEDAEAHLAMAADRFPTDDVVVSLQVQLAASRQDFDAVVAAAERYTELPADPANDMLRLSTLAQVAAVHGQLEEAERLANESARAHARTGRPNPKRSMTTSLVWLDATARGNTERARKRFDALLAEEPLEADEPMNRNYLGAAFTYARLGDRATVERLVSEFEAAVPEEYRPDTEDTYLDLEGVLLLGEGRWEESLEKQRQRDFEDCVLCRYIPMAILFDSLGVRDSAIVYYERFVEADSHARLGWDSNVLALSNERLGYLWDEAGDPEKASIYLARFIELWDEADAELQPRVDAARARLAEILRERG
jgi:tetratricopeptide (TPR) repeat protein